MIGSKFSQFLSKNLPLRHTLTHVGMSIFNCYVFFPISNKMPSRVGKYCERCDARSKRERACETQWIEWMGNDTKIVKFTAETWHNNNNNNIGGCSKKAAVTVRYLLKLCCFDKIGRCFTIVHMYVLLKKYNSAQHTHARSERESKRRNWIFTPWYRTLTNMIV